MEIPKSKGNYVIVWENPDCGLALIPRFGNVTLPSGYYFYCGSAHGSGGLRSRTSRHLQNSHKKRWHIDYLKGNLHPIEVWWDTAEEENECAYAAFLSSLNSTSVIVSGFGASDCSSGCQAHLIYALSDIQVGSIFQEFSRKFPNTNRTLCKDLLR